MPGVIALNVALTRKPTSKRYRTRTNMNGVLAAAQNASLWSPSYNRRSVARNVRAIIELTTADTKSRIAAALRSEETVSIVDAFVLLDIDPAAIPSAKPAIVIRWTAWNARGGRCWIDMPSFLFCC